ncbi:MAG: PAS domain S-box protein, partial [Methanomicrobiales archaeon]|nr:PAS domain S-box protein [Methanomicrobiales archaeon]
MARSHSDPQIRKAAHKIIRYGTVLLALLLIVGVPVSAEPETGIFFIMHENLPPYEYLNHEGQPAGYSCELIQHLARETGLTITILTEQEAGAILSEREERSLIFPVFTRGIQTGRLMLSEPVLPVRYSLYSRDDWGRSRNLQTGDVVIVPHTGSPGPDLLVPEEYRIAGATNPAEAFLLLKMGRGDFAFIEDAQASYLRKYVGISGVTVVEGYPESGFYTFKINEAGAAYLPVLDEGLRELRESGDLDVLETRWFTPLNQEGLGESSLFLYLFTPVALIVLVAFSWSRAMRYQVTKKTRELENELRHRRHAEEELSNARNSLDTIINTIADPVFVKDRNHRWILLNNAYCRFLGYSRDELIGKSDYDFFPKEEADVFWQKDELVFETGVENINEETFTDAQNKHHTMVTKKALYTGGSGEKYIVGVMSDITDRKQLEKDLKKFNEELEQRVNERTLALQSANREMESFTYSVSHDLRAPLRAIDGYSSLLLTEAGDTFTKSEFRLISKIRQNTQQMGKLIDDLLNFSRVGRKELNKEVIGPAQIVETVLVELREELKGRDVRFEIGDLPPCYADPQLLHQVYYNILENALKFTRNYDPSKIEIGALSREGKTVYFVKDNGIGFDMKYGDAIFKPFQQLHTIPAYEGTGVGL